MAEALARSPLASRLEDLAGVAATSGGAVALGHVPLLTQVDLRIDPVDAGRSPYPLPVEPNTAWEEGPRATLWLGPDEWLVLGPPGAGPEIVAELLGALAGTHRSIVDVSANRVALELSGPGAKELLSKGCSLDLDPRGGWIVGRCAQTLLARLPVILHERAETTGVLVRPSFAGYLVDWLIEAAAAPAAQ
ncbi:MAG: sarcosine oxidase subunit gamma [Actinobacteria bacterium]|nr:sarcosine oxidase subunit gamma [Actinomycetota bacterium]